MIIHISKAAIITINKIPIEIPIDPATEDSIGTTTASTALSASTKWIKTQGNSSEDLKCTKVSTITITTLLGPSPKCSFH